MCCLLRFFHLRLGELLALSYFSLWNIVAIRNRRAASLSLVFTRSGDRLTTAYRLSVTSLPTQNRLQSVNTPMLIYEFRVSVADSRFRSCGMNLHLGFRHMTNHIRIPYVFDFSCHYWHPFGVHITYTVSGSVVACDYYTFCI